MPPTTHCRVGPPMAGYLAVYGPPGPDGAEPVVALVPVTNANAPTDAALFAGAARLRQLVADGWGVLLVAANSLPESQEWTCGLLHELYDAGKAALAACELAVGGSGSVGRSG